MIVFVLVAAFVVVVLPEPVTAAFAVTQGSVKVGMGPETESGRLQVVALSGGKRVMLAVNASDGSLHAIASASLASPWIDRTIESGTIRGLNFQRVVGTDTIVGCWYDMAVKRYRYGRSDDGGVFWTTSTAFTVSGTVLSNQAACGVDLVGTTAYYAHYNTVTGNSGWLNVTKSTNSGASWTSTSTAQNFTTFIVRSPRVAASTASVVSVVFQSSGLLTADANGLWNVRTTNGGTSWAATERIGSAYVTHDNVDLDQLTRTSYVLAYSLSSGTGVSFLRSMDAGASWLGGSVTSLHDSTSGVGIAAFSDKTWFIIQMQIATSPYGFYILNTTDGGVNWEKQLYTATPAATVDMRSTAGVAVNPDGRVTVGLVYTRSGVSAAYAASFIGGTTTLGPTATVAVPGLVGLDVDENGQNVIARVGLGKYVNVFNGATLALTGNFTGAGGDIGTNCRTNGTRPDGVDSFGPIVGFIYCDQATKNPRYITIRRPDMTDQSAAVLFGGACDFCDTTIDLSKWPEPQMQDRVREFHDFTRQPMTFVRHSCLSFFDLNCLNTAGTAYAAWGWSANDGSVGVASWTNVKAQDDPIVDFALVPYTTGTPAQICSMDDGTNSYLVAADASQPAMAWRVAYALDSAHALTVALDDGHGVLGAPAFQSSFRAIAAACGRGTVSFVEAEGAKYYVDVYNVTTLARTARYNISEGSFPSARGVAQDKTGKVGAFVENVVTDALHTSIRTRTTLSNLTCTMALPDGEDFVGMFMTADGQQLYAGTKHTTVGHIYRWSLSGVCVPSPTALTAGGGAGSLGGVSPTGAGPTGRGMVGSQIAGAGLPYVEMILFVGTIVGVGYGAYRFKITGAMAAVVLFGGLCLAVTFFRPDLIWVPGSIAVVGIVAGFMGSLRSGAV